MKPKDSSPNKASKQPRTVQQYVKGESLTVDDGLLSVGTKADELENPEASILTTESLLTNKTDLAKDVQKGEAESTSTAQQRRFSIDWDPIQYVLNLIHLKHHTNTYQPSASYQLTTGSG